MENKDEDISRAASCQAQDIRPASDLQGDYLIRDIEWIIIDEMDSPIKSASLICVPQSKSSTELLHPLETSWSPSSGTFRTNRVPFRFSGPRHIYISMQIAHTFPFQLLRASKTNPKVSNHYNVRSKTKVYTQNPKIKSRDASQITSSSHHD